MGAYVQLLEYNGVEGMILLSELSRRRIRSINRLVRVGRNEVVMVIRVDKEKGYIDLSKRRVSSEDIMKCEERYNKAKAVHSIVKHLSSRQKVPMLSIYTRIAWPLYKRHGHAYEAFSLAVTEPDSVLKDLDITPAERKDLIEYVTARMTPQPLKIRADIQVTCFNYEGIEAVREALLAGQALSSAAVPIKVQLIAPPLYVMTTQCLDKVAGIGALTAAIAATKKVIEAKGGQLNVKMAVRACVRACVCRCRRLRLSPPCLPPADSTRSMYVRVRVCFICPLRPSATPAQVTQHPHPHTLLRPFACLSFFAALRHVRARRQRARTHVGGPRGRGRGGLRRRKQRGRRGGGRGGWGRGWREGGRAVGGRGGWGRGRRGSTGECGVCVCICINCGRGPCFSLCVRCEAQYCASYYHC